ncbi:hypothetical protein BJV82DRAFT_578573 [Fennellomyces sp. T-0311]|nr:hypothetical protein BJV82DRAFT_578573 [Fennellomyces sp. T-0311]
MSPQSLETIFGIKGSGVGGTQHTFRKRGLYDNYKKTYSRRMGNRTRWEAFKWYLVQIDIAGAFLLVGGLAMILLPLVLARTRVGGWASAKTLGTLCGSVVIGSGMMDNMAMVTVLFQVGGSIAASIGSTMAGSVWNNM